MASNRARFVSSRHRPRFDTSICPDPAECAESGHDGLVDGDCCECCGTVIGDQADRCLECDGEGCDQCDGTGEAPTYKQPAYR